ncbi:MAG: hypothetical protein WKF81_04850 [Thermomicrobiales bacterium]
MAISLVDVNAPIPVEQRAAIERMDNNSLIIRLHFTINHLSRWLSPIHDEHKLERSRYRDEPSPKEILVMMRNEEHRIFPKMHLISVQNNPDLDKLPEFRVTSERAELDEMRVPIALMGQFRRLRQSTCSLLRSVPDDAWSRQGFSRTAPNTTIRELALYLAECDYRYLSALDRALDNVGARTGLAEIQKTHLDDLLKLVPERLRI